MKTGKIFKVILMLSIVILTSCNKDDEIKAPTLSFADTDLEAVFFTEGQSGTPSVDWNGDEGSFSFAPAIQGLSINPKTGQLSWDNTLPVGEYMIEVSANNKKGSESETLNIENPFSGNYIGTYVVYGFDTIYYFQLEFNTDGTIKVTSNDNRIEAFGTWTMDGNEITANFEYSNGLQYSLKCNYTHTANEVVIDGEWYRDYDTTGTAAGSFTITMSK